MSKYYSFVFWLENIRQLNVVNICEALLYTTSLRVSFDTKASATTPRKVQVYFLNSINVQCLRNSICFFETRIVGWHYNQRPHARR